MILRYICDLIRILRRASDLVGQVNPDWASGQTISWKLAWWMARAEIRPQDFDHFTLELLIHGAYRHSDDYWCGACIERVGDRIRVSYTPNMEDRVMDQITQDHTKGRIGTAREDKDSGTIWWIRPKHVPIDVFTDHGMDF